MEKDREDFENWAEENHYLTARYASGEFAYERTNYAFAGWQARQPEIDALKAETTCLKAEIDSLNVEIEQKGIVLRGVDGILNRINGENAALKAENERLRNALQSPESIIALIGSNFSSKSKS